MLRDPGDAHAFRVVVQRVLAKTVLRTQRGEGHSSFSFVRTRDGACGLPVLIGSHLPQASLAEGEHGVVEGSSRLQMCPDTFGLPLIHDHGQFQQQRGRFAPWLFFRLFALWLLLAHSTAVYSFCLFNASSIPPPLRLERNGGSSP